MSAGMRPRPNRNTCRERMYKELKKTEEGRRWMEESEARINDYLEEKSRKKTTMRTKKKRRRDA